jgi:hypothetical protein
LEPEESPEREAREPGISIASFVAALAFAYSLLATVALLLIEGFFNDYDNQRTLLVWLLLPMVASFLGWLAVTSPNHVFRLGVWFLVLAVLFFCWLAIFSVGVYYLPVPFLMVMSVLGPWDGAEDRESR